MNTLSSIWGRAGMILALGDQEGIRGLAPAKSCRLAAVLQQGETGRSLQIRAVLPRLKGHALLKRAGGCERNCSDCTVPGQCGPKGLRLCRKRQPTAHPMGVSPMDPMVLLELLVQQANHTRSLCQILRPQGASAMLAADHRSRPWCRRSIRFRPCTLWRRPPPVGISQSLRLADRSRSWQARILRLARPRSQTRRTGPAQSWTG